MTDNDEILKKTDVLQEHCNSILLVKMIRNPTPINLYNVANFYKYSKNNRIVLYLLADK